jgi:hypothetical protein
LAAGTVVTNRGHALKKGTSMQAIGDIRTENPFARKRTRVLALIVAMAAMALVPAMMHPATSEASACGYQYWGSFVFRDIPIPKGQLTHCINGSGQHVNWDGANFASAGNLCDSSMKFTYGYGSQSISGNVHAGCSHVGQWKYSLNRNVPRGQACAELWIYNWQKLVTKQCHFVS